MRICVVGLGYIGLPTAAILVKAGYDVFGYDVNDLTISAIRDGKISIEEPGFEDLFREALSSKRLHIGNSIQVSDVYMVAVSTSLKDEGQKADLGPLKAAVKDIAEVLKDGDLVIIESTVPPGTTVTILKPILDAKKRHYYLAFCPERVLPGDLVRELVNNDRIIGGIDPESTKRAKAIYKRFVKGRMLETDALTAELAKLFENTYRTVNIALANELAILAEGLGGDVWSAIEIANSHPRVHIHLPGPGVGGYCLTKDPWFLIDGYEGSKIIKESMKVNANMPAHVVEVTLAALQAQGKDPRRSKIVVLGAAYKGNVADPRESQGFRIYALLRKHSDNVVIQDPYVKEYRNHRPAKDLNDALKGADVIIIVTEHDIYKKINWDSIWKKLGKDPVLIDTRNIMKKRPDGYILIKLGKRSK